jgi:colanic acid/amylovoran/stewartan biosynthesis glycosyltransferase WcaL/AmsK/CpsK
MRTQPPKSAEKPPCVLQRCDQFVGRTINWLYDHLRCVPRHTPIVLSDTITNRQEFPLLEARSCNQNRFARRLWRRLTQDKPYPLDTLWMRRFRPRILHSHFGYVAVGDYRLHTSLSIPWLVSFYGADVYELGRQAEWRDEYARLFEQASLFLALGPEMGARLEALGCPKAKIVVHPLGVDIDALPSRQRLLERGSPLRILFAGTFREKKGIEYAVRGAAQARRLGVDLHLTLVGDVGGKHGDLETKEAVFREIDRLHMNDVVTHHPFMPFDQLIQIALASHVFVAPSITSHDGDAEGTPFVVQQMMATGMPVISTVHSDIPFLFGEHRHRLIRERDADAIAAQLACYAAEPEKLLAEGAVLRQRIRSAFDVHTRAAALSDIYDGVLVGPG